MRTKEKRARHAAFQAIWDSYDPARINVRGSEEWIWLDESIVDGDRIVALVKMDGVFTLDSSPGEER